MNEPFDLPVEYKGKTEFFKAQLLVLGYTHKIEVDVHGTTVLFEPDEERNYRAILPEASKNDTIDIEILKSIIAAIKVIIQS